MKTKTLGALALAAILGLGLLAGVATAASPSSASACPDSDPSDNGSHGMMIQGEDSMNGSGPFGTCTMDQERTMNRTCSGQGSMNSYGPKGVLNGQFGNGPGYTDCPYYPCGGCAAQ